MKVLVVAPYFAPKIGGMERIAQRLAVGLRDYHGHEVVVVTANHEAAGSDEIEVEGLRVRRLAIGFRLSNTPVSLTWYRQLKAIIKEERPDIVNVHSPVPFMADVAAAAARKLEVPYVVSYHAGSMRKTRSLANLILVPYERIGLPRLLNGAASIATYYPAFIQAVVRDKHKLFYAPPGVDLEQFYPATSKPGGQPRLLFVGRIEKTSAWKGIATLLEAFALIRRTHPDAVLQLAGPGDAIDDFKQQAVDLGVGDGVEFLGSLAGAGLRQAYQSASLLVLPSESDAESFGMVMIEAMACGTPVVGTRVGGIPGVILATGGGLLAPPANPKELAHVIARLLRDDNQRIQLAAAGLAQVKAQFTWRTTVNTYHQHLQQLARPRPLAVHISALYPPNLGGMENVAYEISRMLADQSHPVEVVTSAIGQAPLQSDQRGPYYKVTRLRAVTLGNLPILPGLWRRLWRMPKRSLFHIHVAQAGLPEVATLVAKLRGIPTIAHFHLDVAPSGPFGPVFAAYKRFIFPRTLRQANRVIVFSGEQARLVVTKYGVARDRVIIIPNGVAEPYFYKVRDGVHAPLRVLFVGRLSPQKNVTQLLRAIDGTQSSMEVRIVGEGELGPELEALAASLKLHNVEFRGRKSGEELRREYRWADVLAMPSEREGMPLVLLEAMAAGLPVVGTDVVGLKELISERNGSLVELHDASSLQAALVGIARDHQQYRHKSVGALETARRYSWERLVAQLLKVYENVRP